VIAPPSGKPGRIAPGTIVGRYEVVGELGAGGMAVVYRARDRELGRDVALKLLASAEDAAQGNTRLLREAQALAQLSHPNVIAVYDVGRFADGVFLAMELVEGQRIDAWIREKERNAGEVLPVFRDAARGLEAAHARGIVHRDFKPSNLILGSDGRVRVLDFGLARAADPEDTKATTETQRRREISDVEVTREEPPTVDTVEMPREPAAPRMPIEMSSSKSLLDSPLTQEGALVGTPPYMAPEQHFGRCDARSDQFSFCISFWAALYGERPFTGLNFEDLKSNMAAGRMRPPPPGRSAPAWLLRVLVRGLSPKPEDRFPSMAALLEALERDPAARRRLWGAIAGVAMVLALGAFGWWRSLQASRSCGGATRKIQAVWDDAKKGKLRAAFAATQKAFAADAFAGVARAVDRYASEWTAQHDDACEATRVRGEQSAELLDLRMECLSERLDELRAQLDEFASADGEVVERAPSIARALPPPSSCGDAAALRAPVRPPDGRSRRRVESLRRELARVRALWQAGRYAQADPAAEAAVREAQAVGYRPVEGEALLLRGRVQDSRGQYVPAERSLRDARVAAEAGRADDTAALATSWLVWVVGERQGRYAEARELGREAEAKLERMGKNEILLAELESKLSAVALDEGKYDDALGHAARSVELLEKSLQPDDPALGSALGDRGDVEQQLGRYADARKDYTRALAISEKSLGPEHPKVASLLVNFADAWMGEGKTQEALPLLLRARRIAERSLAPQHPMRATIAVDLGKVHADRGELDAAVLEYRAARALWTQALGADHPNVATVEFRLGEVAMKRGKPDEAAQQFQRALDAWEKKLGPDHPSLAAALDGLGDALMADHKPRDAAKYYERALAILVKAVGPDHPDAVETKHALERARKSH
jgi:eukaryotic-like serine/threonine-protein kinase